MRKLTLLLLCTSILLQGCSSQPMSDNEAAVIQSQLAQQTFQIKCPAGCEVNYRDPRTPVSIPHNTNGWDAAISITHAVTGLVGSAIVPGVAGYVAVEGFKALKGSGAIDNSVAGNVNTGNSGRIDSSDDYTHVPTIVEQPPVQVVEQSPPVIVNPPETIVVEQPAPIIVEQPSPIIIDQPTLVSGGI